MQKQFWDFPARPSFVSHRTLPLVSVNTFLRPGRPRDDTRLLTELSVARNALMLTLSPRPTPEVSPHHLTHEEGAATARWVVRNADATLPGQAAHVRSARSPKAERLTAAGS